mmetsp:Transcript_86616/g.250140  ORF Transcript_86616/g.250140 Transcript_86616/m.250140 type:complete len:627 (+) Transcript_86616:364-2244(+)
MAVRRHDLRIAGAGAGGCGEAGGSTCHGRDGHHYRVVEVGPESAVESSAVTLGVVPLLGSEQPPHLLGGQILRSLDGRSPHLSALHARLLDLTRHKQQSRDRRDVDDRDGVVHRRVGPPLGRRRPLHAQLLPVDGRRRDHLYDFRHLLLAGCRRHLRPPRLEKRRRAEELDVVESFSRGEDRREGGALVPHAADFAVPAVPHRRGGRQDQDGHRVDDLRALVQLVGHPRSLPHHPPRHGDPIVRDLDLPTERLLVADVGGADLEQHPGGPDRRRRGGAEAHGGLLPAVRLLALHGLYRAGDRGRRRRGLRLRRAPQRGPLGLAARARRAAAGVVGVARPQRDLHGRLQLAQPVHAKVRAGHRDDRLHPLYHDLQQPRPFQRRHGARRPALGADAEHRPADRVHGLQVQRRGLRCRRRGGGHRHLERDEVVGESCPEVGDRRGLADGEAPPGDCGHARRGHRHPQHDAGEERRRRAKSLGAGAKVDQRAEKEGDGAFRPLGGLRGATQHLRVVVLQLLVPLAGAALLLGGLCDFQIPGVRGELQLFPVGGADVAAVRRRSRERVPSGALPQLRACRGLLAWRQPVDAVDVRRGLSQRVGAVRASHRCVGARLGPSRRQQRLPLGGRA